MEISNSNIASSNITNRQSMTNQQKMEKTAKDFESFFIYSVLEQTQPEIDTENDFFGGTAEQTFRPILNEHLAAEISEAGGLGIKENVIKQMQKYQEVNNYAR